VRATKTTTSSILAVGLLAGSAVGVAAQSTPAEFSGELTCGEQIEIGTQDNGVSRIRKHGRVLEFLPAEMSDPRLDGPYAYREEIYEYPGTIFSKQGVTAATWSMSNQEGGWIGSAHSLRLHDGGGATTIVPLYGVGDYEGLTAIMEAEIDRRDIGERACVITVRGIVVEGDLPPFPEPPVE
jgi:hypothetical protein